MCDLDLFLTPWIQRVSRAQCSSEGWGGGLPHEGCVPEAQAQGKLSATQSVFLGCCVSSISKFWCLCFARHWVRAKMNKQAWHWCPSLNLMIRTALCKPQRDSEKQRTHRLCWEDPSLTTPEPCLCAVLCGTLSVHWLQGRAGRLSSQGTAWVGKHSARVLA